MSKLILSILITEVYLAMPCSKDSEMKVLYFTTEVTSFSQYSLRILCEHCAFLCVHCGFTFHSECESKKREFTAKLSED